jgi:1-acyl-sn-glycerol-3-phosphate acyltransferase
MPASSPPETLPAWRRTLRYWIARLLVSGLVRAYLRVRVEGRSRLPAGPAMYVFNHLGWSDPFILMSVLPFRPRLYFFGPKEEDIRVGARNRVMAWTGTPIPFRPEKDDLVRATRRMRDVLAGGSVVAIAGEGRIHASESELWPLNEGAAFFALRSGVPIVPIAINGTSWLRFGGRVRVQVGEPLAVSGRPDREAVDGLTQRTWVALHAMVSGAPEVAEPGRFGRWLTDRFNDWPEGSREATAAAGAAHRSSADSPSSDG